MIPIKTSPRHRLSHIGVILLGVWFVLFLIPSQINSHAKAALRQGSFANIVQLVVYPDNSLRARVSAYSPGYMHWRSCRQSNGACPEFDSITSNLPINDPNASIPWDLKWLQDNTWYRIEVRPSDVGSWTSSAGCLANINNPQHTCAQVWYAPGSGYPFWGPCGDGQCLQGEQGSCPSDCPSICGNGMVETPEQCEPPNTSTCNSACQNIPVVCGNGIVQSGEQCEPPNGTTCDNSCQTIPLICGNGIAQPGEQCEPPNGTTCDSSCRTIPIVCGNGIVQPGEQCEPPNNTTCDNSCRTITTVCGNGIVQPGEQCEPPNNTTCDSSCRTIPTVCGNNILQPGEQCEPPNNTTCDNSCRTIPTVCGNNILQPGEQCEPPNNTTCDNSCRTIPVVCGNNILQPGEQCEPPNNTTCDNSCRTIPVVCGNHILQPGEQCEPPDGTTCDDSCKSVPIVCGNNIIQAGEQCEPPNTTICDAQCRSIKVVAALCGNSIIESGEQCDPPNGSNCSATCQLILPRCGNSRIEQGEQCDPPNGTTCGVNCQTVVLPHCGNRVIEGGEQCDPPDGTTCNNTCSKISTVCGNGVVQPGEQCDPPNGDTCNTTCQRISIACGNGILQSGEQCDPPNGTTCSSACKTITTTSVSSSAGWKSYEVGTGDVTLTGAWEEVSSVYTLNGSYYYSSEGTASARLQIVGEKLRIRYLQFSNFGIFDIYIDGVPVSRIDGYSAKSSVVISEEFEVSPGPHIVDLRNTGEANVNSDGIVIALDTIDVWESPQAWVVTPVFTPEPSPTVTPIPRLTEQKRVYLDELLKMPFETEDQTRFDTMVISCAFDPTYLKPGGAEFLQPSVEENTPFSLIEDIPTEDLWLVTLERISSEEGDVPPVSLSFEPLTLGYTQIDCEVQLGTTDDISASIVHQLTEVDITPEPSSIIGKVYLQGVNNAEIQVMLVGQQGEQTLLVAETGEFKFSDDLFPGDYTLRATAPGFLSAETTMTFTDETLELPSIELRTGDLNNDDVIDELDLITLTASYGKVVSDVERHCDLDGSQQIDINDLYLLARNFRQQGPLSWDALKLN